VFSAVSYYVGETYSEADADVATEGMLFLTSLSGFGGAVFGVIAALDTRSDLADATLPAVLAVLGNMAAALAYGLEKEVVAGTEGISVCWPESSAASAHSWPRSSTPSVTSGLRATTTRSPRPRQPINRQRRPPCCPASKTRSTS
jgi:hypothetical protein